MKRLNVYVCVLIFSVILIVQDNQVGAFTPNFHKCSPKSLYAPESSLGQLSQCYSQLKRSKITCELQLDSEIKNEVLPPLTYSVFGDVHEHKITRKPIFAHFISWILRRLVETRTQFVSGLEVNVLSHSNRDILRGRVNTLELKFDKIAYGQLFVSGGGRLILQGLDLRMRRFLFQNLQSLRKPYKIYGDFLLTQADIINSKFIRNLIQLLVNTILERVFAQGPSNILQVVVKKVSIRARRLFASGEVSVRSGQGQAPGGAIISFEVSTGAGVRDQGQVLFLKDIQVVLNPDSILRAVVPILLTSPIDVDLGDDCRLDSLVIANKHVWIRANSVISPVTPFQVTPVKSKALYRYDLAALLSNVLKLHGGVAVPWKTGQSDLSEEENEVEEKKRNALMDEEVARLTSFSSLAVPLPVNAPPR